MRRLWWLRRRVASGEAAARVPFAAACGCRRTRPRKSPARRTSGTRKKCRTPTTFASTRQEERTRTVNVCKYRQEDRTRTVKVCKYRRRADRTVNVCKYERRADADRERLQVQERRADPHGEGLQVARRADAHRERRKYRPETRTCEYKICKYVNEPRTKEVQYTVCKPEQRTRTYTVCRYECQPEEKTVNYTVCVPETLHGRSAGHGPPDGAEANRSAGLRRLRWLWRLRLLTPATTCSTIGQCESTSTAGPRKRPGRFSCARQSPRLPAPLACDSA